MTVMRAGLSVLAAVTLFFTGCDDESAGPEAGADIEDVTVEASEFEANRFVGQEVVVSGKVTELYGAHAIELAGDNSPGLLVVGTDLPALERGDVVRASGIVRDSTVAGLEEDLGIDLDEAAIDELHENALVADRVDVIDDGER